MKRRCAFLDQLPAFNYNSGYGEYYMDASGKKMTSDTRELGSTLMSTMLQEVVDFCDPEIKENWSLKAHQQVKRDFCKAGQGTFAENLLEWEFIYVILRLTAGGQGSLNEDILTGYLSN